MKKFVTKLFVFLMILSFAAAPVVAFAASAVIAPPLTTQTGTLYIHKYGLPNDEVNAGTPGTGVELSPGPDGDPLDDIVFDVYKVTPLTAKDAGGNPIGDLYPSSPVLMSQINTTALTLTQGTNVFPLSAAVSKPTVSGVAAFAGLNGVYLVIEREDTTGQVDEPAAPFLVAVPMTNPADNSSFLQDVHVYPKNEMLTIDKAVTTSDSYNVGDQIVYKITADVPNSVATDLAYAITDQLDPALNFVGVTVKVGNAKDTAGNLTGTTKALVPVTDYTVTPTPGGANALVKVDFPDPSILSGYLYVEVTLTAQLNDTVLGYANYTVGNNASIELTNQYGEEKTVDTQTTTDIHTAAIEITKVDALTPTKTLPGAKFKIASSEANAAAGNFLKLGSDGNIYEYNATLPGTVTAADWEVTTNASGVAIFAGIKDYDGFVDPASPSAAAYKTYYLVETQAPTGYNLVPGVIKVTFDGTTSMGAGATYTATVTVSDSKGFTLPKTGGAGGILFTVGGIALAGTGVLILIGSRKKKGQHAK